MKLSDLSRLAAGLDGVAEGRRHGLLTWRCRGRMVARQVDGTRVAIRSSFEARDLLLRTFPGTFTVPARFRKHRTVVADLAGGDRDAIEEAVIAAWRLQSTD